MIRIFHRSQVLQPDHTIGPINTLSSELRRSRFWCLALALLKVWAIAAGEAYASGNMYFPVVEPSVSTQC
jgi:hypothetical protein